MERTLLLPLRSLATLFVKEDAAFVFVVVQVVSVLHTQSSTGSSCRIPPMFLDRGREGNRKGIRQACAYITMYAG